MWQILRPALIESVGVSQVKQERAMKLPIRHIAVLVLISLLGIFAYQGYWLGNMYKATQANTKSIIRDAIQNADHEMFFYNRQRLSYIYESDWGLSFNNEIKTEEMKPAGSLQFLQMENKELNVKSLRTTEFKASIRYCPGLTFVTTKQQRLPVNLDAPEFSVSHSIGVKGFLGGDYHSNVTELHMYKRTWFGSWGYINTNVDASAQWNRVPFPLLLVPPVNTTYIEDESTFGMAMVCTYLLVHRLRIFCISDTF